MVPIISLILSSMGCLVTAKSIKATEIVKDIIHDNFRKVNNCYISDIMIFLQLLYSVFILNKKEIYDICSIMSLNQILRIICMKVTVLPLLKRYNDKKRFLGLNGNGTEYIYSGHASYSAITFIYLLSRFNRYGKFSLVIYNIISQILIIFSHNHYTIDVILAWLIVFLLYTNTYVQKYLI